MSKIKSLRKVNPKDPDLSRMEKYVQEWAAQFLDNEILGGLQLKNVLLTTGQLNKVEHKLDRPLLGWFYTRKNANSDIWDEQSVNTVPSRTLDLQCSANVTVDLWVY